ncbi:sodium/nucleoside cotransporter 2-like isoform X2 [Tachypleus tridentatus]|uniref:sodium/nucleoside cotransporter 2-like isoform X2 n=1 Tax=Tachypleus tridentatus TaxID=6853 RepID=UPI003FD328AC
MASLIFTITDEQDTEKDAQLQTATDFVNRAYENELDTDDINKTVESHEKSDSVETANVPQATRPDGFTDRILIQVKSYVKKWGKRISLGLIFVLYNIYLGFAVFRSWKETPTWCDGVKFLVIVTTVAYFFMLYDIFLGRWIFGPTFNFMAKVVRRIPHIWVAWIFVFGGVVAFLVIDTKDNRKRLVSAGGLLVLLAVGYIFSAHRKNIIWRQVLWGVMLQFVFGFVILRLPIGRKVFQCLGDKIEVFLSFTDAGSSFVFGYLVTGNLEGVSQTQAGIFAFKGLPVIIFFSFIVSILYYYGIMQWLVSKTGWFLQVTIGTTACESMNAAGNIFLGMTEAPLMIKPYLPLLTKSELHAVMTGGFATIAGTVLALYVNIFGVNASHLLTASVMSAPAALAYSKLFYPELEQSKTKAHDIVITKGTETNALEAAANGASSAIKVIANIVANLVAFVAFVAFLDAILQWCGNLVGWDFLTFEWILSKVFMPLAFLMGVDWSECGEVGQLLGLKTIVNEFVAYQKLKEMNDQNLLSVS